jgi:CBS domain-containing protein
LQKERTVSLTARQVMDTRYKTLRPEMPISEAVSTFQRTSREQGQMVFGMMVTDEVGRLLGLLSIYDILLLLRPKHIHIWGEMEDLEVSGILEGACQRAKGVLVGDIMTIEVITITPDTHLLLIIDIMIKKHVRRLPVVEDGKIVGIVYLSRVFNQLLEKLAG